jgi:hypothetical protein
VEVFVGFVDADTGMCARESRVRDARIEIGVGHLLAAS